MRGLRKGDLFELVKCMWRNHLSVYQDHPKYIHNDIVKPFRIGVICHIEHVMVIHDLVRYLPPPSMKGRGYEAANWKVRYQELSVNDIWVAIKDELPSSMQNELEEN